MEKISRNQRMSIEVREILKYMDVKLKSKIPSDCVFCLEGYQEPCALLDQQEYIETFQ